MKNIVVMFIVGMAFLISSCQEQTQNPLKYPDNREQSGSAAVLPLQAGEEYNSLAVVADDDADANIPKCILLPALPDWPTDYFDLEQSTIEGDILAVSLSYTGGCVPHEFRVVVSTTFEDTDQPRISGEVFHTPVNDPCDQWVTQVRKFDLSPLKEFLLRNYPDTPPCFDAMILLQSAPKQPPVVYHICRDDHKSQ